MQSIGRNAPSSLATYLLSQLLIYFRFNKDVKNALIGAALLGPISAHDNIRKNSPWIYKAAGESLWGVLGVIRWKFDANGPSYFFKNLNGQLHPEGTDLLKQPDGHQVCVAVSSKLRKGKYITSMDPESGMLTEIRRVVKVKRKKDTQKPSEV